MTRLARLEACLPPPEPATDRKRTEAMLTELRKTLKPFGIDLDEQLAEVEKRCGPQATRTGFFYTWGQVMADQPAAKAAVSEVLARYTDGVR